MGILFQMMLGLLVVYLLVNALFLAYCYLVNRFTGRKEPQLVQEVSSFFVRKNEVFTSTILAKGPKYRQEHEAIKCDIVLLIDYSGSMAGEPEKQARSGASTFVKNCSLGMDTAHIGVVVFNQSALVLGNLSPNQGDVLRNIKNIPAANGVTSLSEGLNAAKKVLDESERKDNPNVERIIVLLSDGYNGSEAFAVINLSRKLKKNGIRIYSIGVTNADQKFLEQISGGGAEEEGKAFYTSDSAGLVGLFEEVRETIVPATGKSGKIELELNLEELRLAGTVSEIPYSTVHPATWNLPWLKEKGEKIEFKLRAGKCVMGIVPLNKRLVTPEAKKAGLLRIDYMKVTSEGNQQESLSNSPLRYVYIVPSFGPPWVWALTINPWLWKVGKHFFCKTTQRAKLETKPLVSPPVLEFGDLPPFISQQKQNWHPTLSIGLGGGGIETALRFRAFLSDASGGSLPDDTLREIFIDTDQHRDAKPVFGSEMMQDDTYVSIGADLWELHKELLQSDAPEFDWYDRQQCHDLDRELFLTELGASRIRLLGRLSLHNFLNQKDISRNLHDKMHAAADWLRLKKQEGKTPKVFVFCTASGGTGSAVFQDITHMLIQTLENQAEMASQEIDLIIPDIKSSGGVVDHYSDKVFNGNKAAFLLELERVKSTIRYSDHPSHPGAIALKTNRSTNHDYIVNGDKKGNLTEFDASALLALCKSTGDGNFSDAHSQKVAATMRERNHPGEMPSLVHVAVSGICQPVTLIEQYSDSSFVLELLRCRFGISLDKENALFKLCPTEWNYADDALRQLFLGDPLAYRHDEMELKYPIPLLFQPFYGLTESGLDQLGQQQLMTSILIQLNGQMEEEETLLMEARSAACRVLEWLQRIMNREDVASLAMAKEMLSRADQVIVKAYEVICSQEISTYKDDLLLRCTPDALDILCTLISQYREVINRVGKHLSNWEFTLAEGFPRDWSPKAKSRKVPYVGVARRFARRQEIQCTRMGDYPRLDKGWDDYAQECYLHRIDEGAQRVKTLYKCVSWELRQTRLEMLVKTDESPIQILKESPFTLKILNKEDEPIEWGVETPEEIQPKLERKLFDLASEMRPWLRHDQLNGIMEKTSVSVPTRVGFEEHMEAFEVGNSEFPKGGTRAHLHCAFGNSFRGSSFTQVQMTQAEDAWNRGNRYHVFTEDAYSALFQKAVAKNIDSNSLIRPQEPRIVYLLHDLHRLQRFLYLYLGDSLEMLPMGATGTIALAYRDGKTYFLSTSQSGKPSTIDAAVQFVLEKSCLGDGTPIPLDEKWRPTEEDCGRLDHHLESGGSEGFLGDFDLVLKMMQHHGGYIPQIGRISSRLGEK